MVDGQTVGLVIEVAGVTLSRDLGFKAELYAQHGVREYWVVDLTTMAATVHRGLAGGVYRDVLACSAHETIASQHLPGLALCLQDLPAMR